MGAASHTTVIPPPRESAASQYRVGLIRFAPGRVLVFHGGVFGCSSRMNGKPSSPVLRGLGASNGARLLDHTDHQDKRSVDSMADIEPVLREQTNRLTRSSSFPWDRGFSVLFHLR